MARGAVSSPRALLFVATALRAAKDVVGRRRGYPIRARPVVPCQKGHLFTTLSIPSDSSTAIPLGWWRFQYPPVARHESLVTRATLAPLSTDNKRRAAAIHDIARA